MKIKLLLSALFISGAAFAQEAIPSFYNFNASPGGVEEDVYTFVSSPTPIDQSATGANIAWIFNQLVDEGQSSTRVIVPTEAEVNTFPGSTMLVRTTAGNNVTNYYLATTAAGGYSLTGFQAGGMELNYSSNNGFLGDFPLSYGFTNTDDVAGTFEGMGAEGFFTGTGVTTVDAYGTLTVNVGTANATPVTRLKIVQDIDLTYLGFPVGTVNQTIYSYYGANLTTGPVFRSISTTLNIPILNIVNQTTTTHESYTATALGTTALTKNNTTIIAPNPVANVLHFAGDKAITGVTITDASGRVVLQNKAGNDIAVSHLSTGVYYVAVQSANGTEVQKMIKQ
ncbi:hypothetical protein Q765_11210 [Flavobacterium rivuli WB 3.3-2 = DSM 21788]|uniref:Secretion system C-terminal sorting domain-containing protein n=1 Tax=Flavobacterium rivuli WB 3.3-2 = DSM 21788 TaxID=1121895 RepID=A0A0A2MDR1_9FLAO|nr:T9SS type A sorting domain-containing protein [Flavobacterium rivuli]KGO86440.1 hypothetical protein Q765_11210 [Flavobacterium rivuli WB 3.3-2 = DSM 21788]